MDCVSCINGVTTICEEYSRAWRKTKALARELTHSDIWTKNGQITQATGTHTIKQRYPTFCVDSQKIKRKRKREHWKRETKAEQPNNTHIIPHVSLPISQNENWEFPFPAPAHITTCCQANTHTAHGTFSHAMHQGIIIIIFASIFILRNEYNAVFSFAGVFQFVVQWRVEFIVSAIFVFLSQLFNHFHTQLN